MLLRSRLPYAVHWWKQIGNRKARRSQAIASRSCSIEVLEIRTVMSAVTGTPADSPWDPAVAARVQKLLATQFGQLQPSEVKYLTTTQLQSVNLPKTLALFTTDARGALSPDQIRQLPVGKCGLMGLTSLQIDALTVPQIQSLRTVDFNCLHAAQIPSLTTIQVKTISTTALLRALPNDCRIALTGDQLKQMSVATLGLSMFSDAQIETFSVTQIQSLKAAKDVAQLLPSQTKSLTAAQWTTFVGTVENSAATADKEVSRPGEV